jgi:Icc-related predicted phosphoesterase
LKAHLFGHIHDSSGELEKDGVKYINAAMCDEGYNVSNPIRKLEL